MFVFLIGTTMRLPGSHESSKCVEGVLMATAVRRLRNLRLQPSDTVLGISSEA